VNILNVNARKLLKNINYTVSANFLVMGISIILNLLVPKYIGVKEYSFWQLYVFYVSYIGFFHFGWLDGIYLKIGGENYEDLPLRELGTQFWYFLIFQLLLALSVIIYISIIPFNSNKFTILFFSSIVLVVTNCKSFILYIFQSTNRIKEYAQLSRNDRYIYIIGVMIYLFCGGRSFIYLILIDVVSRLLVTFWGIFKIRKMILLKWLPFNTTIMLIIDNIKIGANLMIGNIASILVVGVTRIFVEKKWSIEVFGKLSFTLSISGMFMTFINAVGVVMFPLLRRTKEGQLSDLYKNIRSVFVPFTYLMLLFFFPVKVFLNYWLPMYSTSLDYMGILFPMIVYEGRMALLIGTYIKVIRKEKFILLVNLATLLISVIGSLFTVFILQSILMTVLTLIICIAFRCVFAEMLLADSLQLKIGNKVITEMILTIIFISSNFFLPSFISFTVYSIAFVLYIIFNRKDILNSSRFLLSKLK
jgi:O-antigen/teichoic acid export membrane protein